MDSAKGLATNLPLIGVTVTLWNVQLLKHPRLNGSTAQRPQRNSTPLHGFISLRVSIVDSGLPLEASGVLDWHWLLRPLHLKRSWTLHGLAGRTGRELRSNRQQQCKSEGGTNNWCWNEYTTILCHIASYWQTFSRRDASWHASVSPSPNRVISPPRGGLLVVCTRNRSASTSSWFEQSASRNRSNKPAASEKQSRCWRKTRLDNWGQGESLRL